jgi:hypothetical protein
VWLIPCLCWALSLFRFIPPNIILFAYGHQPAPQFLGRFGPLFDAIWAASAANDLLIAGTLVVLLYGRRNAGLQLSVPFCREKIIIEFVGSTVEMVDKLIAWTIGEIYWSLVRADISQKQAW